jgi:hypothetical protein
MVSASCTNFATFMNIENIFHLEKNSINNSTTSIERKSRMRQIRGVKGEAVVVYCDPLTTKEMAYHRLSRRVNKMEIKCIKP